MTKYFCLVLISAILLTSCAKQNEILSIAPLSDYYPLQVGKYITYNLDSTVYINFGKKDTIKSYQVKDSIDAQITDNLGNPGYRILRFIRKNASQNWAPNNTFYAVPKSNSIEYVENNLRFIKLVLPIKQDYTWRGNNYLPSEPYPSYSFANPTFMEDWDYIYQAVDSPAIIGNIPLTHTLTIFQTDQSFGSLQVAYAERSYSIEKYAKSIGLVYKEFLHWEYQSNNATFKGFGVKLTMIDHN
jgi:hypothetical protein